MSELVQLPIIVNGESRYPDGVRKTLRLRYRGDLVVEIPEVTEAEIAEVLENRERLSHLSLPEVSNYLANTGAKWVDPSYKIRKQALELSCKVTGFSKQMLQRDYWVIGDYLMFRNNYYDLLDSELGDHHMMDEWVRRQVARVRAFPRGRTLHVMVGNVPMAAVYSTVRSVLTRNQTVVKLPARDPVTTTFFVQALIDANGPDHPLSRSMSVFYWPRDSDVFDTLAAGSDLVCAWGQGSALQALKGRIPHSVPFLEFGPKRSMAILWPDESDLEKAAMRIAHDVAIYDQEACFSPQRLFVIGDAKPVVRALRRHFEAQERFLPRGKVTGDVESHIYRTKLEAQWKGFEVNQGAGGWTVITADDPYGVTDHPLSRTLFVHPIKSLSDIAPFVDDETQTVAIYPFAEHAIECGDFFGSHGALRVVESGMVAHFRQGFTHDGGYPLQQFVRLVYIDEPLSMIYKYGPNPTLENLEAFFFGPPPSEGHR